MKKVTCLFLCLLLTACYRTEYSNFRPKADVPAPIGIESPLTKVGGWQHFFLWGLVPKERRVDASAACGSPEQVARINIRQTFFEGLVESVAGFYINIYSPWDGAVYCRGAQEQRIAESPLAMPKAADIAVAPTAQSASKCDVQQILSMKKLGLSDDQITSACSN